ncbi:MAG: hypothetical protein VKI42_09870 [Synechococcaceae cyanobacterium]|nr:hypothetical protein [Synechococcaceae cyanobacterium]
MSDQQTLHLELSIEDVNLILEALGEQPFKSVYGLVSRLQNQARGQLQSIPQAEGDAASPQEAP